MATVVMADDGIAFDGLMAETAPLGGAETAFVALAEALAARGHRGEARSRPRAADRLRSLHWQSQPPGHRARPRGEAPAVLAAQPCLLFEEAAPFVAARLVPADPGGDRSLSRGDNPALAALRRARDHPLWCSRSLPGGAAARPPAADCDLHLQPAARARLAARSLDCAHPACGADGGAAHLCRRCRLRPRRNAASAADGRGGGPCRGTRRCRGPALPARRTRSAGGRATRLPGHALSWRPWRDLLSGTRRGAGNGGSGRRQTLGLDTRAGHKWGDRVCG